MNAVVAVLVAFCSSVVAATLMAFTFSGLGPGLAAISLCAGSFTGMTFYASQWRRATRSLKPWPGPWEWFAIICGALFSLRAFCWLVFPYQNHIQFLSANNLGDLSLHLTYIRNFANGAPFWPENPIFAGARVHYPIGVDLFNSLLTLAGVDLYRGLVCTGLVASWLTGVALWKWGRGFVLAGFLFNGGLAGLEFFQHFVFSDYQADVAWKSIGLSMFVTQRGLLYAIPAGLVLLWSWKRRFFANAEEDAGEPPLPMWVEVLLYSTMPLFHLHTFIFLSLMLACWGGMMLWRWLRGGVRTEFPAVIKIVAWAFIPASILTGCVTGFFQSGNVVHMDWDWMYREQPQFDKWAGGFASPGSWMNSAIGHLACWAVNFGILPLLVVWLVAMLLERRNEPAARRAAAFVLPATGIFVVFYFVMLAKWSWDNTKIMIWSYLAVLPFLWEQLLARRHFAVRAAACAALFTSGFISLFGGIDNSHTGYDLATRSSLDGVEAAVRKIPAGAVFAAFPTYNHPLLLNGRIVVAGYPGHLYSHGIDYQGQMDRLTALMRGAAGWRKNAETLHVRYIFWGPQEERAYADSSKPWEKECALVASGPWGKIYDVTQVSRAGN